MPKVSVIMPVYNSERTLIDSLSSLVNQTLTDIELILVNDYSTDNSLKILADCEAQFSDKVLLINLNENHGAGGARNIGLSYASGDYIGFMDSDDIAYPDRCEKQVAIFNKYPIVSICSGTVMEFSKNPETINCKRVLPEKNKEIIEFAKKRNPFNHPCVMYKKSAVEAVGSYQHFYLLEDYYLWIRMLMAGYEGYNIQEPLLYMRAGTSMYKRRAGRRYAKTQIELFRFMWKQGFINAWQYAESCIIRSSSALSPNWLRKYMYITFLRS